MNKTYLRLSSFYLFYFAALGVLAPYWSLYLQSLGFGPVAIGQLMAVLMFSRIVAPNVWGWLADHRERRMQVVRWSTLCAWLSFAAIFFGSGFWWIALVMLVFSFFWHASLPLLEVTTMNQVGRCAGAYGRVRLWGSLGFIVTVVGLGVVIDYYGPTWVPPALFALMISIWLTSLSLPEAAAPPATEAPTPLRQALLRPEVLAFLIAGVLMQVSHGPYYTFYSIYLTDFGYDETLVGVLWALGVVCEIGVFLLMQRLLQRVELRVVLLASFLLATLRWLLIGYFPQWLSVLVFAQTLHAATFGAFHATAIQFVHRFFTGRHQHRGQALYGSISFGLGGAVGSLYSGYAWGSVGPSGSFAIAAAAALAAFVVAWIGLKPKS
ncbi:MAG: MFS transporter [Gammaproteobacteria bacterium]|nr:MFS transporter [Gammaproteobacteria bacterium]